jgi:hypothetical protein
MLLDTVVANFVNSCAGPNGDGVHDRVDDVGRRQRAGGHRRDVVLKQAVPDRAFQAVETIPAFERRVVDEHAVLMSMLESS